MASCVCPMRARFCTGLSRNKNRVPVRHWTRIQRPLWFGPRLPTSAEQAEAARPHDLRFLPCPVPGHTPRRCGTRGLALLRNDSHIAGMASLNLLARAKWVARVASAVYEIPIAVRCLPVLPGSGCRVRRGLETLPGWWVGRCGGAAWRQGAGIRGKARTGARRRRAGEPGGGARRDRRALLRARWRFSRRFAGEGPRPAPGCSIRG